MADMLSHALGKSAFAEGTVSSVEAIVSSLPADRSFCYVIGMLPTMSYTEVADTLEAFANGTGGQWD